MSEGDVLVFFDFRKMLGVGMEVSGSGEFG